jgi:hypothetical protein
MRGSPFRHASATGLSRPDATGWSRTRTAARFGAEGDAVDVGTDVEVVGTGLVGGDCEGCAFDAFPPPLLHAASSSEAATPTTIETPGRCTAAG